MSIGDLERTHYLRHLGLSGSNLSTSDLEILMYAQTYGYPGNRVFATGRYYPAGGDAGPSTNAIVLNTMLLVPFESGITKVFDRISAEVTTAGTTGNVLRMGIYDNLNGLPNDLVVDGGTVASVSTGGKEITINTSLNSGLYWIAVVTQIGVACQVRADVAYHSRYVAHNALPAASTYSSYSQTAAVSGALPAQVSAFTASSLAPKLFLRAA